MGARRIAGMVAGVLSAGAVAAAITVFNLPVAGESPGSAASTPVATVEIAKLTLVDRESHDGTLGHGDTTSVLSRGSGTVTGLPAEGATVTRGKAIFRLDNEPVTLLYGSLPAYRTLSTGVKGADVKQFERNLRALGYRGFTVDGTYSWATASAVRDWQDDLGLTRTGTVDPGQIVYATGAVRVDSLTAQVGTVVGPGAVVEKVTGTSPMATVRLDTSSGRLARRGATVRVTLPDGKVVPGKIIKVATFVSQGENGEADTTGIKVTIGFTSKVKSRGAAAVTVAFTAGKRPNVLAVPVAALLALAEGGYGVQIVDGSLTRVVGVETGLFADGKVEITGNGLQAGMKVAVPS
ncbi:efflux RND transporter periplasmic adaptor subunit [Nonomuraea phyllanthi]|uniref:peptidoglycan-binding protein n=1 Tax=Nonomuraea phyllanthi TaxID=2219224 RepID=UPI0012940E51|nr:peptidoglycan-binding protein [Nonomuraea phyllanthi]QFY12063.1 efflux RND transporter periplasmic adaptor subunit [Nonomuraea phyllanthi]